MVKEVFMKNEKNTKKIKKNKPLKVIFNGPDENFNFNDADSLFNDETEIINKKTKNYKEAYEKTNFLLELICFMHGVPKQFDQTIVNNFAKNYPEILTIKDNKHIYNMNNFLILLYKYNACYIEEDGHIVIDNSVFDNLQKFYKRKIKSTNKNNIKKE